MKIQQQVAKPGFALIAVVVIIAGLLILVTSVLILSGIDRKSSWVQVESYRAELAAAAAVEEASGILKEAGLTDEYFIMEAAHSKQIDGVDVRQPYTYLALPPDSSSRSNYRYVPLFSAQGSGSGSKSAEMTLALPSQPPLPTDPAKIATFRPRPYLPEVQLAWRELKNDQGRTVARYAYWIEDKQRYLNVNEAGNRFGQGGTHLRNGVVPGLPFDGTDSTNSLANPLNQVALFSLDKSGSALDRLEIDIDDKLIADREWLKVAGSSPLASLGFPLNGERNADGRLINEQARLVEENLALGLRSYYERPMIPFTEEIAAAKRGQPMLNLNVFLQQEDRVEAVRALSNHVNQALPHFGERRRGDFPDNYVATLMANALDYADQDNFPTLANETLPDPDDPSEKKEIARIYPAYRGLDGYPVISEFLIQYRWVDTRVENDRNLVRIEVSVFAELWNHANQEISGEYEMAFQTQMSAAIGSTPRNDANLGSETLLDAASTQHNLIKRDGYYFFPALNVDLGPNEYRAYKMGTIRYEIDAGPSISIVASPILFDGDWRKSRLLCLWNGLLCDGLRVPMERRSAALEPGKQEVRCVNPGHSHGSNNNHYNMGDCRIAYYLGQRASAVKYEENYSPGYRNVRFSVKPSSTKISSRVVLSQWPDGGHDIPTLSKPLNKHEQTDPMDAVFTNANPPAPDASYSPTKLSNRGRFLSVTELGHIYDPVMWDQKTGSHDPSAFQEIGPDAIPNEGTGGGNSLRIGRPEHPKFDQAGARASSLLDLFHAGVANSPHLQNPLAPVQFIPASPNLNTATEEVIRLLVAGKLVKDPLIADRGEWDSSNHAPHVIPRELSALTQIREADRIARAIVRSRPFASWGEVARARDLNGNLVFGNRYLYPQGSGITWSDQAAEEIFARLMNTSTLRSRNFRIHAIAEALDSAGEVSARFERCVDCYISPGERLPDGSLQASKVRLELLHEIPR